MQGLWANPRTTPKAKIMGTQRAPHSMKNLGWPLIQTPHAPPLVHVCPHSPSPLEPLESSGLGGKKFLMLLEGYLGR